MTTVHAYELPASLHGAVEAVEHGEVVYLTHDGQRVAAIVPEPMAAAVVAAIAAFEDAHDLALMREARAQGGPSIPWEQARAELNL
ncbi:MAG: hypothetical protein ACRDPW_05915 [Mycobacteriales bacterium]